MKKFEGFSLIELLISFAIITLFILGTAQLLLYSLAIKSSCANNMSAAGISRTKLEYFKSLPYDSPELDPGERSETILALEKKDSYLIRWNIQESNSHLKRIEIECHPAEHLIKKTHIILYLSRELGF